MTYPHAQRALDAYDLQGVDHFGTTMSPLTAASPYHNYEANFPRRFSAPEIGGHYSIGHPPSQFDNMSFYAPAHSGGFKGRTTTSPSAWAPRSEQAAPTSLYSFPTGPEDAPTPDAVPLWNYHQSPQCGNLPNSDIPQCNMMNDGAYALKPQQPYGSLPAEDWGEYQLNLFSELLSTPAYTSSPTQRTTHSHGEYPAQHIKVSPSPSPSTSPSPHYKFPWPSPSAASTPPYSRRGSVDRTGSGKQCSHCKTTTTPLWRREPHTLKPLCNACGLYLQQRNKLRPQELIDADADDDTSTDGDGCVDGPECSHCHTHQTSVWRRSKTGAQLCNACGVYLRLRGKERPLSLKRNKIKPRTKHNTK